MTLIYTKSPFLSKTLWGIFISGTLKVLAVLLDMEYPSEFHGYTLMQILLGLSCLGDSLAIFGRLFADEKLKF